MGAWLVLLTGIYAWATVAFGFRFSNLTHRGILTHGPYAWTKHPAYVSKNLFWWCAVLPFLSVGRQAWSTWSATRHPGDRQRSLLLAGADRGAPPLRRSRLSRLCRMDGAQRPAAAPVALPLAPPGAGRRPGRVTTARALDPRQGGSYFAARAARSSNGKTTDSDSVNRGSNPRRASRSRLGARDGTTPMLATRQDRLLVSLLHLAICAGQQRK
jgi:hypothetical protein